MNESVLIREVERFLDKIKHRKIEIDDIHDFNSFMEIYLYFRKNMAKLLEFRETMEIKGYKAPYRALKRYNRVPTREIKVEDRHDIARHIHYFRMKAAAKKNILDRVKSSIASHKIAIGHLEEFVIITCDVCGKKFEGHDLSLVKSKTCVCGSRKLKMDKNEIGVHRIDIIKHLPLSGDYMVGMSKLSRLSREAFKKIVRTLKHEKRGAIKTVSLLVKIPEDGRWIRKRVSIHVKEKINCEKEIQKRYGPNARIEFLQFYRTKPAIINDKAVRTALSLAYVKFTEDSAYKIFWDVLGKFILNRKKMEIYRKAIKISSESADKIGRGLEDKKEIMENKLTEILMENHLMNKEGRMDEELEHDLEMKKNLEEKLFINMPKNLILWDIIKYYLTKSYDKRSKYAGPFPNIHPELDARQIKALGKFDKFIIEILKKYMHEKIEYISNIEDVLTKKFEFEGKMKGLHVKVYPPAFGAAILHITTDLSIEKSAGLFSLNPYEVEEEKRKIEVFEKPISKKARKFLEIVKR